MAKTKKKSIETNRILVTRDGWKVGNAIVWQELDELIVDDKSIRNFSVVTDYGNKMTLTEDEINSLFELGDIADKTHKYFVVVEPSVKSKA